jgi:hypothetical protein
LVNEIRIYFEGDGALKPGFHAFLCEIYERASALRCSIRLIAAEGTPVQDYMTALKLHAEAWNVLLLDSEDGPPSGELHLRGQLPIAKRESIFWMVQAMESWFLADITAMHSYYGTEGFKKSGLPANPKVEEIPKLDVLKGIKQATRKTGRGEYHKTHHAPALLQLIDPAKVRKAAPNCERIFRTLLAAFEVG